MSELQSTFPHAREAGDPGFAGQTALRYLRSDRLVFVAAVTGVLGLYALLHVAFLNPVASLDPWIYTALFSNFGYLYHVFTSAYWTSRLPWIIPGIGVHSVLPPLAAFLVLHITFFTGGGLSAYLLARRFYGARVALVAASTLMLSPLFFNSHSWDYPDGPTITYVLAAAACGIGAPTSSRRSVRLAAAGFFAAAAFGTQIYAAVAILGVILCYLVVEAVEPGFARRLVRVDLPAAAAGVLLLLAICGSVARASGGSFLFFLPSWRYAHTIQLSRWQLPGHAWMLHEPQLLIPPFLLALLAVLLSRARLRGWRADPGLRFAAGSALFLGYMLGFLSTWELAYGADFFEVSYYFSMFLVPVAFALPAALYMLVCGRGGTLGARWGVTAIAAAVVPLVLVYALHVGPVGGEAFDFVAALMALVLAAALLPGRLHAAVTVGVVAVAFAFTVGYAGASGSMTRGNFSTSRADFTQRRASLAMAMQLISFMRANGLQTEPPSQFWYDGHTYPALDGIQSTYLWGLTWIGRKMPVLGPSARHKLDNQKPPNVVLLCGKPGCSGGPAVLEHADYRLVPKAATVIHSRGERFWVRAYEIPKFKPLDPVTAFYTQGQARLAPAVEGSRLSDVRFSQTLPGGWKTSDKIVSVGGIPTLTTSSHPWYYEVVSSTTELPPGRYRVYLRGKVLAGGLDLGVLDAGADRWIEQRTYWSRQTGFDRGWMMTPFELTQPTPVQFILSNWVPSSASSRWQLRELVLVRAD